MIETLLKTKKHWKTICFSIHNQKETSVKVKLALDVYQKLYIQI